MAGADGESEGGSGGEGGGAARAGGTWEPHNAARRFYSVCINWRGKQMRSTQNQVLQQNGLGALGKGHPVKRLVTVIRRSGGWFARLFLFLLFRFQQIAEGAPLTVTQRLFSDPKPRGGRLQGAGPRPGPDWREKKEMILWSCGDAFVTDW